MGKTKELLQNDDNDMDNSYITYLEKLKLYEELETKSKNHERTRKNESCRKGDSGSNSKIT